MAFTVELTSFSKPFNSTSRPSAFSHTASVELKGNSGINNPVLRWAYGTASPHGWNYVYIPLWSRYYFISDWVYVGGGVWDISLKLDVMATYKDQIGASAQYVLRSSVVYDTDIVDNLYPEKARITRQTSNINSPFQGFQADNYSIVLGVIGKKSSNNRTGINYYVMNSTTFNSFLNSIFGDNDYFGVSELSFNLLKSIANPSDYITTCKLFPFSVPTGGTEVIKMGWWNSEITGNVIAGNPVFTWTGEIAINKHPQAATRGSYLNVSASRYMLISPLWGNIPINPASIKNASVLQLMVRVDCISGVGDLLISADGIAIEKTTTQISTEIPIGQVSQDFMGAAASALGGVGAAMAGNTIGVLAAIGDVATHLLPQARISGTIGNAGAYYWAFILTSEFMAIVDGSDAREGRPCCRQLGIAATGNGYYQVRDAYVPVAASADESREIKSIMESGFYYE